MYVGLRRVNADNTVYSFIFNCCYRTCFPSVACISIIKCSSIKVWWSTFMKGVLVTITQFPSDLFHLYWNEAQSYRDLEQVVHYVLLYSSKEPLIYVLYMDNIFWSHLLIIAFMWFIQTLCHQCIKSST